MKNLLFPLSLLFVLLFSHTSVLAQVPGCRDPQANNYNAAATINDGSCQYNSTSYNPPYKTDMDAALQETSGLQYAAGALWSFNDGGGLPAIYKIDTLSSTILQTVTLEGASNVDWEDIAFDGTYFYIGDFGNNANGARTDLMIYKFAIADIPSHTSNNNVTIPSTAISVIHFIYSDQVQPPVATSSNATRFDCEAMIIDNNKAHLFTKNWVDTTSVHYVINSTMPGTYLAVPLETLATGYFVTAADKAVGEDIIVLLGYQSYGFGAHYMHILTDYSNGFYFNGNKRRIDLGTAFTNGQSEGITFRNSTYGYISNERVTSPVLVTQKLRSFNTSAFVSNYILPAELLSFNLKTSNGLQQLSWAFASAVKEVELQHSTNGQQFSTIYYAGNYLTGKHESRPTGARNFYRLSWKQSSEQVFYSNILQAKKSNHNDNIENLVLSASGKLQFKFNSDQAGKISFNLFTTDGRVLAKIAAANYRPGQHTIHFPTTGTLKGIVAISVSGESETFTRLISIQ